MIGWLGADDDDVAQDNGFLDLEADRGQFLRELCDGSISAVSFLLGAKSIQSDIAMFGEPSAISGPKG